MGADCLSIVVDPGELKSGIVELLRDLGMETEIAPLQVGDYLLSQRACVERKTAQDFVASIKTKRLFRQLLELKENCERPLFLIEGYHLYEVKGVRPSGIRGALALITVCHGIPVVFTRDKQDTAEYLATIWRQEHALRRPISLHPKRKALSPSDEIERIVGSFPGVGPTLTRELLTRYGTIEELLAASVEDLKSVPMVGEKKASRIKEILRREYRPEETKRI